MAVRSDKNLYPGVNAHFNSFLQQDGGGWESFHAEHIVDLRRAIKMVLPPGYVTLSEKSLQISALPREEHAALSRLRLRPDVTIFQSPTVPKDTPARLQASAPIVTLPHLLGVDEEAESVMAVTIYDVRSGRIPGKPVTRIELLSPSNKPPGNDYHTYLRHRSDALKAGINLVEIDLLHEQVPIDRQLANYRDNDSTAFPYVAIVSKAQPTPERGSTMVYGAGVLDSLPSIIIPLKNDDQCVLDLNQVYQQTFASLNELAELVVDYAQDPPNFDRYRPDDQARIRTLLDGLRAEQNAID